MKLKTLLETMATRAGLSPTDAKLLELMAAIPDIDVDDDTVAKPITTNLITESEAEARPTIKSKFTAQALNGVDALLNPALADFFDEAEIASLDKSTTKRLQKFFEKAKAAKASGTATDSTKAISDLNAEIAKLKADSESTVNTLKSTYERERYYDKLATRVIARNDVTDYAKAKDGKRVITDLEDTLNAVGGILDITTGKVMQKADPTMPLFIDNKPVTVDTVLERTLKENDYLKKSDPAPITTVTTKGGGSDNDRPMSEAQRRNLTSHLATTP